MRRIIGTRRISPEGRVEFSEYVWFGVSVALACIQLAIIYVVLVVDAALRSVSAVIVFLFENWVLQAAFGAWVAFSLQQLHQKSVQKADLFQRRYDQKLAAIQLFFGLIDKRIYASRAYLTSLRSPISDDGWVAERERYRQVVREWNEKAPGVLVTLLTLLPARICFQLERETFLPFSAVDGLLGHIRESRGSGQRQLEAVSNVQGYLSEISTSSAISLAEFLNLAREERRLIDRKPSIIDENAADLSFGYLITSLFKSSVN